MADAAAPEGSDFTLGVPLAEVPADRPLAGRVGDEAVLLSRIDGALHAVSGACTHYGGPLAKGLSVGRTVRCPWHHACFDLATGEALRAPAFARLDRWKVETEGDRVFVREKLAEAPAKPGRPSEAVRKVVIVGGGAAGFAAAERLRGLGYDGAITMLSADRSAPYDRPNLSKDYLAGTAPEEWIPLKDDGFWREHEIDLRLGEEVTGLDTDQRRVTAGRHGALDYDALLLATGAEPAKLTLPGFDAPNVFTLRSLADSRDIIAAAKGAERVVVLGASFIGLEVAASLRSRGLDVLVVAPGDVPLGRVLGPELGGFVQKLHESKGVRFRLGCSAQGYDREQVLLSDSTQVPADFVVMGVGVKPRIALAEQAGLALAGGGVGVNARFQTSAPGVFAAGDIAAYPDPLTGERIRIEHWVAAERQGQVAAAAMLGLQVPPIEAPFFWSQHYDTTIRYVGHVKDWDAIEVDGSIERQDCAVRYLKDGRVRALATINRDHVNLEQAAAWEPLSP